MRGERASEPWFAPLRRRWVHTREGRDGERSCLDWTGWSAAALLFSFSSLFPSFRVERVSNKGRFEKREEVEINFNHLILRLLKIIVVIRECKYSISFLSSIHPHQHT